MPEYTEYIKKIKLNTNRKDIPMNSRINKLPDETENKNGPWGEYSSWDELYITTLHLKTETTKQKGNIEPTNENFIKLTNKPQPKKGN